MRESDKQRGLAAVELALLLPVLSLILFLLVEGSQAIRTYSQLLEASREGARLVLRAGDTSQVAGLVDSLLGDSTEGDVTTTVSTDPVNHTVTVAVNLTPTASAGQSIILQAFNREESYVMQACTTMPLP